jgi:hypothetical protein
MTEQAAESPVVEREEAVGEPYSLLFLYADSLNDIEKLRIATKNRLRVMKEEKGLTGKPEVKRQESYLYELERLESQAVKELEKAMKEHPLIQLIDNTVGLGRKQMARLLAAIGDPGARDNVGKLWAYCGMHVVEGEAPRLRRGQLANWNTKARMRVILVSESVIKQKHSALRMVYDLGRLKYSDAKNPETGQDLTPIHKHNRARRLIAKEILKLLWIEAKHKQGELDYSGTEWLKERVPEWQQAIEELTEQKGEITLVES